MAEALYWTIDAVGLRPPSRRDIASRSYVSEATVSRRLRESVSGEEGLVRHVVEARSRTYPPGYPGEGWAQWVPRSEHEIGDARVWIACLALAGHSEVLSEAVRAAWLRERQTVCSQALPGVWLSRADHDQAMRVDALHALLVGLAVRRVLDPDLPPERAIALIHLVMRDIGLVGDLPDDEPGPPPCN